MSQFVPVKAIGDSENILRNGLLEDIFVIALPHLDFDILFAATDQWTIARYECGTWRCGDCTADRCETWMPAELG
jgi:hypothetical protein